MRILSAASMIRPLAVLAMVGMLSQAAIQHAAGAITVTSLGLYNTGKDAANVNLAPGSAAPSEPHYTLIAAPLPVLTDNPTGKVNATNPAGPWLANNSDSQWITPKQFASPPPDSFGYPGTAPNPGDYIYTTTFSVTAGQLPYLEIKGRWATDNTGKLYLNKTLFPSVVSSSTGFGSWTDFILNSGFVEGTNTLEFVVFNAAQATGNPTGLRAEFLSATVPEPASLVGWGLILGAVSVGTWFKRRRTQSR